MKKKDKNIEVTESSIELELLRREERRRKRFRNKFSIESDNGFWEFCKYIDPDFFYEEKILLKELALILQKVAQGVYKKVAITMMPRTGKSYTVSIWCVWMLGHHPEGSIMRNTYGAKLANKFSRDIRNMIGVPGERETELNKKVKKIFPYLKLSQDKRSVEEWALTTAKDISYFCGGAGGAITGFGCNLAMILDDPIKNIEEAHSETRLDDIEAWYSSTHRTRKELGSRCPEIIIMTRWSINDTIGKRLKYEKGEWKLFEYPALTKDDKSICEAIASTDELLKIKSDFIASGMKELWYALYMCEPYEEKGKLFPEDKLQRFILHNESDLLKSSYVLSFVDFADGGGDYFCAVFGKIVDRYVYIVDVIFSQKDSEALENELVSKVLTNMPVKIIFEANAGGKTYARIIRRKIKDILSTTIVTRTSNSNKMGRIINWSGVILKNFKFLATSEYKKGSDYSKFIKNLTNFTRNGKNKNDDAPDACAGLASMVGVKRGVKVKVIGNY